MVAYAPERGLRSLLLFLSTLSEHTRNLMLEPRVALVISEPDPSIGDPQTLARLSVKGTVHIVERTSPELEAAWRTYVGCFPAAASRRVLGDFFLFRLTIVQARYVAGLGQARTIAAPELSAAGLKL